MGRMHRYRNHIILGTSKQRNWTVLSDWSVPTWWASRTGMKSEFHKQNHSKYLFDLRLKNNFPALWIHSKSCEYVDVSFSGFVCSQALQSWCGPCGQPLLAVIHTPNSSCTAGQSVQCDWSVYVALSSAGWILRFVEVNENTYGPYNCC